MTFITEYELKFRYQHQPFDKLDLTPTQRLTPEARQFLVDRGITVKTAAVHQAAAPKPAAGIQPAAGNPRVDILANYVQMAMYDIALACQKIDTALSQKVFSAADDLQARCRQLPAGASAPQPAPDTFRIGYLYALHPFGRQMVALARLGNELLLLRDNDAPAVNQALRLMLATLADLIAELKTHDTED